MSKSIFTTSQITKLISFAAIIAFAIPNLSFAQNIASASNQAPSQKLTWVLYEKFISFSGKTQYMKTTGFSGFLFGHFSQAHQINALKQIQRRLAIELKSKPGVDINFIQLLPPTIVDQKVHAVGSGQSVRTGLFGTQKVDRYEKYQVDYKMRINFLYPGHLATSDYSEIGPVNLSARFEIKTRREWTTLGTIGLNPNLISLDAVDLSDPSEDVARLSLSDLHKKYQYELGQFVTQALPSAKKIILNDKTDVRIFLDFKDSSGQNMASNILESTDDFDDKNDILKSLGVKGVGRYFNRYFYMNRLMRLKQLIAGGSVKCKDLIK